MSMVFSNETENVKVVLQTGGAGVWQNGLINQNLKECVPASHSLWRKYRLRCRFLPAHVV